MNTELHIEERICGGFSIRPLFKANWEPLILFNYVLNERDLQKHVPFEVDTFKGKAFVSLVAFSVTKMRMNGLPDCQKYLLGPLGEHEFLNVRTYIKRKGERGIYFLTEFVNRVISLPLGMAAYGLPYSYTKIHYSIRDTFGYMSGSVRKRKTKARFEFEAKCHPSEKLRQCEKGSEAEFLMERYVAFTKLGGLKRKFYIEHQPWQYCPIDIMKWDDRLIKECVPVLEDAELVNAYYSPGVIGVGISRPHGMN